VLSKPLLYPLVSQLMGIVLWIGLTYQCTDYMTANYPNLDTWLVWTIFFAANLPGMILFLKGFWKYVVWVSALNLVIRELVETGECGDTQKYAMRITNRGPDYSLILTFLFGMVFIPAGLAMIPIAFSASRPDLVGMCMVIAAIIFGIGMLMALILGILFSLVFQVFAFTPGSAGASFFRSMDLVGQKTMKTVFFLIALVLVTQFLIPTIVTWGFQMVGIVTMVTQVIDIAVQYVLQKTAPDVAELKQDYPMITMLFNLLMSQPQKLSEDITISLFYTFLSALSLPLGSCWFALLYADLKTRHEVSEVSWEMVEEAHPVP
jgi:hypothetical protein